MRGLRCSGAARRGCWPWAPSSATGCRRGARRAATPPPFRAAHAAVASDNALASAAGVAALKAAATLSTPPARRRWRWGWSHPDSSGIGGGGFAVVYLAKEKKSYALDFRERAPAAITPARLLQGREGSARAVEARRPGGGGAGRGARPQRDGAALGQAAVQPLRRRRAEAGRARASRSPGAWRRAWRADRSQGGRRQEVHGDVRRQAAARRGRSGAGPSWPGRSASCARAAPTPSTRARWPRRSSRRWRARAACSAPRIWPATPLTDRTPLATDYRGLRVYSMPPSSSGGVVAGRGAGDPGRPLSDRGRPAARRARVVGLSARRSPRRSSTASPIGARFLGDTDFVTVDLPHLTSAAYHAELARRIKPDAVLAARRLRDARRAAGRSTRTAGRRTCRSSTPTETRWR